MSDIDFWSKDDLKSMELKNETKMYPPRVKMTVMMITTDPIKLSIDVIGCSRNSDMDLVLPIGKLNTVHYYSHCQKLSVNLISEFKL